MIPLIAFFVAYALSKNIFLATAVCIIASWLHLLFCKFKFKRVNKNTWINVIVITIFGGLTIVLHNKTFVMLKPTVLYWLLGGSLLIGQMAGKNGLELLLHKEMKLPPALWSRLNTAWGIFFILMGFANLWVARNFSEYVWVKFKVFGTLGLTILFALISGAIIFVVQYKTTKNRIR